MQNVEDIEAQILALQEKKQKMEKEKKLKEAWDNGDLATVRKLIGEGIRINLSSELRIACQKGQIDLVKLLLEIDPNIEECNGHSFAPVVKRNSCEWQKQLYIGDAIHHAIRGDHPEILKLLIEHTVKLQKLAFDTHNNQSYRKKVKYPGDQALANQIVTINELHTYPKELVLSHLSYRNRSLLAEAVTANSPQCIKMLLNDYNVKHYSRVVLYSDKRLTQSAPDELDQNTLVVIPPSYNNNNNNKNYVVYWESYKGSRRSFHNSSVPADQLDNIIARLNKAGGKEKEHQVGGGLDSFVETTKIFKHPMLADEIALKVNCTKTTSLYDIHCPGNVLGLALDYEYWDLAKILINHGVEIECIYNGLTPLLIAAKKNNLEMVQLLLKHGANVTAKDAEGHTADQITTDENIRSLFINVNSIEGHLGRLPNPDPTPNWLICPLTKKPFNDPIADNGIIVERLALKKLNQHRPDNNKISATGKQLTKQEYEALINSPTLKPVVDAFEHFTQQQEKKARDAHISQQMQFKIFKS